MEIKKEPLTNSTHLLTAVTDKYSL